MSLTEKQTKKYVGSQSNKYHLNEIKQAFEDCKIYYKYQYKNTLWYIETDVFLPKTIEKMFETLLLITID